MGNGSITRSMLSIGMNVEVNPRADKTRKKIVSGALAKILTGSESHPHGILVELDSGEVGRIVALPGREKTVVQANTQNLPINTWVVESVDLSELPNIDEGPFLEYKSSALWSKFYTKEQIQKGDGVLKRYGQDTSKVIVAKTLASFLNTDGGVLVVGIKEDKASSSNEVIGIESEYKKLKDPCEDGYRRMMLDYIIKPYFPSFVFNEFNKYLKIDFRSIDGKTLCAVYANKSDKQVFLSIKKEELFYIRVDASSRAIEGQDLVSYCVNRF